MAEVDELRAGDVLEVRIVDTKEAARLARSGYQIEPIKTGHHAKHGSWLASRIET